MSILQQDVTESRSGFKKEIDEGGISLLLDTVQIYIYQFPARSSIRECVSNAIDSITEKNIAKSILRKESVASDYYIEKEGDIYKDSKFDEDYYNLNYLSDDDSVYIKSIEGDGIVVKDKLLVRDNGVGLGGTRLEGFFKIAYSSKRLNKKVLGAFGLGAKAPLATGVDSFMLKTAHNGKEFSFIIYEDKVDCGYTKWNEDGSQNNYITFSNGFKVYYKETTSTNFVELSWDVKRHQKQQYIDAVKSQLLYFRNPIDFSIKNSWGTEKIDFQAKILHETDNFIIADQRYYSKPHLIVNGVCYGFVQFYELEMDTKHGAVGIKVQMDDITVTPSRESCVWNTKTKDTILAKYNALAVESSSFINDYLSNLDFIKWVSACVGISRNYTHDNNANKIAANLAALVGFSSVNLKYKNTGIKFDFNLSTLLGNNNLELCHSRKENSFSSKLRKYVERIRHTVTTDVTNLSCEKVFIQSTETNHIKNAYLIDNHSEFVTIRPASKTAEDFKEVFNNYVSKKITYEDAIKAISILESLTLITDEEYKKSRIKGYKSTLEFTKLLLEENTNRYEEVVVPDGYKAKISTDPDEQQTSTAVVEVKEKVDLSKIRKNAGKILVQYPRINYSGDYVLSKTEMTLTELDDCEDTIVYGTRDDLGLLNFLYTITRKSTGHDKDSKPFEGKVRVCVIAKTLVKDFKSFTHVKDYLFGKNDNKLCDELIKYYTANMVKTLLPDRTRYIKALKEFSKSIVEDYEYLHSYMGSYSHPYNFNTAKKDVPDKYNKLLENILSVQTKLLNSGIEEALEFSKEKFNTEEYTEIEIFDKTVLDKLSLITDFDKVFGTLFSEMKSLMNYSQVSPELAMEIRDIIEIKRENLSQDYPDLCC